MKKIIIPIAVLSLASCVSTKEFGKVDNQVESLEKQLATLQNENKALRDAIIRLDERTNSIIQALNPQQEITPETVFNKSEVPPMYPQGDTAMFADFSKLFVWPEGVQFKGDLLTKFVVEKDGSLSNFSFPKDTPKELAEAIAKSLLGMKKWIPGTIKGEKVRVLYNLTITI